jgi:hypothetical protein
MLKHAQPDGQVTNGVAVVVAVVVVTAVEKQYCGVFEVPDPQDVSFPLQYDNPFSLPVSALRHVQPVGHWEEDDWVVVVFVTVVVVVAVFNVTGAAAFE